MGALITISAVSVLLVLNCHSGDCTANEVEKSSAITVILF